MTALSQRLDEYLSVRRSLGYNLSFAGRVLRGFARFADLEGADHITVSLFLRWKDDFGAANNNTWSARLCMVRGFAGWLQGYDARTEVPPPGLIAGKLRRTRPYIYSDTEVCTVVARAARLPSRYQQFSMRMGRSRWSGVRRIDWMSALGACRGGVYLIPEPCGGFRRSLGIVAALL